MNYEKLSVKKYIILLFLSYASYFYAMQLSLDSVIHEDGLIKIIACCEPRTRNQLAKVNKNFRRLAAKTNTSILYHSPLELGKSDAAFYMMYYCDEGNINIVRNLLENGADPDPKTLLNTSPIVLAFQNKHYEVANLLKEYLSIDKQNIRMNVVSPVAIAVYKGDLECIKYFWKFRWRLPVHERNLLHIAVANNNVAMVLLLTKILTLEIVQFKDTNDYTALYHLVDIVSMDMVQLLLSFLSIDEKNKCGRTPLHYAASIGRLHTVALLLDHKAAINIQDVEDNTALHFAVECKQELVVKLLIDRGAQLDVQNMKGNTPLHFAVINNDIKIAELLLANSAKTDIKNNLKQTALDCAIVHKASEEFIALLCKYGAQKSDNTQSGDWLSSVSDFFDSLKKW